MADNQLQAGPRTFDDSAMFHFTTNTTDTVSAKYRDFCIHIFCIAGSARVRLGEKEYELKKRSCIVILNNSTLAWLQTSADFEMRGIFIANRYMTTSAPDANYNTMGILSLMENPVVRMTEDEMQLCISVAAAIRVRLTQHDHMFYRGVLRRCVETLMLDIYNIRAHSSDQGRSTGSHGLRTFRRFISMLESGEYRREREVRWYSGEIGITPKYLSEICIAISGHGASYWINKFTIEEVARLLQNPTMSINSIATLMNFKTRSYFSHYVKDHLGMTPKDYRMSVLGGK